MQPTHPSPAMCAPSPTTLVRHHRGLDKVVEQCHQYASSSRLLTNVPDHDRAKVRAMLGTVAIVLSLHAALASVYNGDVNIQWGFTSVSPGVYTIAGTCRETEKHLSVLI